MKKTSVYLLPVITASNGPSSSAFVRLLLPYVKNPALTTQWDFHVAKDNRLPAPHEADIIIIERDAAGIDIETISDWLKVWRAAGNQCVLELDDDLFDAEGLYKRTRSGKWTINQTVAAVKWLANAADAIITSTPHLQKLASEYNPKVFLLANYIDPDLWQLNESKPTPSGTSKQQVKIGYVGTATHHDDLMIIAETMKRLETEYAEKIKIEVIGAFQKHLDQPLFGKAIPLPKKRTYPEFVTWLKRVANWDIAVIPLEDVHFNKSKSNLKFLECSAMGIACICSDVSTYSDIVENDKNGLLVKNTEDDWYRAIKSLIEHPEKRQTLAQAAYAELVKNYTTHANATLYHQILSEIHEMPCKQQLPEVPYQAKNRLEKYLIKRWGKYNRLWSKLLNNPHHYFADSKHALLRPLKHLFSAKP